MNIPNLQKTLENIRIFLEYFNNYIIKSKKLYRFYFPADLTNETIPSTKKISDLGEITDSMNILPGYDFSVVKYF